MESESLAGVVHLVTTWKGQPIELTLPSSTTIYALKVLMEGMTRVRVERQKVRGGRVVCRLTHVLLRSYLV